MAFDWENKKEEIRILYLRERLTLDELKKRMAANHRAFTPSISSYRTKIREWNFRRRDHRQRPEDVDEADDAAEGAEQDASFEEDHAATTGRVFDPVTPAESHLRHSFAGEAELELSGMPGLTPTSNHQLDEFYSSGHRRHSVVSPRTPGIPQLTFTGPVAVAGDQEEGTSLQSHANLSTASLEPLLSNDPSVVSVVSDDLGDQVEEDVSNVPYADGTTTRGRKRSREDDVADQLLWPSLYLAPAHQRLDNSAGNLSLTESPSPLHHAAASAGIDGSASPIFQTASSAPARLEHMLPAGPVPFAVSRPGPELRALQSAPPAPDSNLGPRPLTRSPRNEDQPYSEFARPIDDRGNTLLHHLAMKGPNAPCLLEVMKMTPNLGAQNQHGQTFLHVLRAENLQHQQHIQQLLNFCLHHGFDFTVESVDGITVLAAVKNHWRDLQINLAPHPLRFTISRAPAVSSPPRPPPVTTGPPGLDIEVEAPLEFPDSPLQWEQDHLDSYGTWTNFLHQ